MLPVLQSGMHIYYSYDSVTLPVPLAKTDAYSEQLPKQEHPVLHMKPLLPSLAVQTIICAGGMAVLEPIVYAIILRRLAWNFSLYFAALLWDVPGSRLSYIPPYHYSLIFRSWTCSTLLITLWGFSNFIFSAYLVKPPLKGEQPLTSKSKDPNASLLNGLKAKREIIRVSSIASSNFEKR